MKPATTLYRMFSNDDRLLYVGVTWALPARIQEHQASKQWWSDIARIELQEFPDRASAEEAERRCIATEKPVHNIIHAGRRPRPQPRTDALPLDPVLAEVAASTDALVVAREEVVAAIRAAFDGGCNRDRIARAAGVTRDAVYKMLARAS